MVRKYDLEERTEKFAEEIISLCQSIKDDRFFGVIVSQLMRSGTSIGANYMEANAASSRKDFRNKIYICKKETQETKYWRRIGLKCFPERKEQISRLWIECHELNLIFQKITTSLKYEN